MSVRLAVCIEGGAKRTFASAIDWPGWSRSGKSEEEAIAALLGYAERYRSVLAAGRVAGFPSARRAGSWDVAIVERLAGGSGTDFGVPSQPPSTDSEPLQTGEAARLVSILDAAWAAFDARVETARGHELRLGPRGGGRDLGKIVDHVRDADRGYLVQLGARPPRRSDGDEALQERAIRKRAAEVVAALAAGDPVQDASRVSKPWSPRYYVRRAAWHALDHAWELEDRRID